MESNVRKRANAGTEEVDYLVFSARDYILALPYFDIIQIIDSPTCTTIPNMPKYLRGAVDFMGEPLPLIDTRIKLSIQSRQEEVMEFVNTFMMRKQDHLNWIDKLKNAVYHDEEILVERDPHKCAFGKWHDTYRPNTLALATYMAQFDAPHKAIHRLADQAEELLHTGQKEQAKILIHEAENKELVKLINLFDGFEEQMRLSYQEYAIVVVHAGQKYALSADSIKYFDKMDEIVDNPQLLKGIDNKMIQSIGRMMTSTVPEDIAILDLANFLELEG